MTEQDLLALEDAEKQRAVVHTTDKYFSKSRAVIQKFGDRDVTYGVFMRRPIICAIQPAVLMIGENARGAEPIPVYAEGSLVPAETPFLMIKGKFSQLVEQETLLLQRIGLACTCGYNAYRMAMTLPNVAFMDMHSRHAANPAMTMDAAYGAGLGSKLAQAQGAKGFIGSSTDITSSAYGKAAGMGTMPHAIIGYAGSTLRAAQMYRETHQDDKMYVTLVDYYGQEITDSLAVARWFFHESGTGVGQQLGVRLDTHGGRFAEFLDYDKSVEIVCDWLHVLDEWAAVRKVLGEDAFDIADNDVKDRTRRILFGTGVSAANIINTRRALTEDGFSQAKIVASSGFNLFKCKIMAKVGAPIDMIGTGSFLPETYAETFATADIFAYDGEFSVKVGREKMFQGLL